MDKQEFLEETYNSAFNNEFKKIATGVSSDKLLKAIGSRMGWTTMSNAKAALKSARTPKQKDLIKKIVVKKEQLSKSR